MNVLVVGATGGSGRAAVAALSTAGHTVTAFARHGGRLHDPARGVRGIDGDALSAADLDRALPGHAAVIVTLGIAENALRVRLLGARGTSIDVRSAGTRQVIAAMARHGVRRLVVQSSYGVGDTRDRLPPAYRLMFALLLKPQIADTERQERAVRASGLDWVLVQPVNLTDGAMAADAFASTDGDTRGMKVSRLQVGRFLARAVDERAWVGRTVALSGG